jgi:hypothetical protein
MRGLVLKQLLQVMDIGSDKVTYDLVFGFEGKGDLRLPVPKETADVLIKWLYGQGEEQTAQAPEEREFVDDEAPSLPDEEPEEPEEAEQEFWEGDEEEMQDREYATVFPALNGTPLTEDEVPSL